MAAGLIVGHDDGERLGWAERVTGRSDCAACTERCNGSGRIGWLIRARGVSSVQVLRVPRYDDRKSQTADQCLQWANGARRQAAHSGSGGRRPSGCAAVTVGLEAARPAPWDPISLLAKFGGLALPGPAARVVSASSVSDSQTRFRSARDAAAPNVQRDDNRRDGIAVGKIAHSNA